MLVLNCQGKLKKTDQKYIEVEQGFGGDEENNMNIQEFIHYVNSSTSKQDPR